MNPEQNTSQINGAPLEVYGPTVYNKLSRFFYSAAFLISCIGLFTLVSWIVFYTDLFFNSPDSHRYDYIGRLINQWSLLLGLPFYFFVIIGKNNVSNYSTIKSFCILLFSVLLFLFGPLNLAGYYYSHIPHSNIPKSLLDFETKIDSGYYKNSLDAYNDCKNILPDMANEKTQLDASYTRNCAYKIALYFNDPMVCQKKDENDVWYYDPCRNPGNMCAFVNTFDADCLRIYSIVKQQDARCDLIPDYKSTSTSSPIYNDPHTKDLGNFPREFCREKSQLKESSRFRQF